MNYNELIGKKVSQIFIPSGLFDCSLFLQGGNIHIQIKRGYYSWRLRYNGDIIISSADLCALFGDQESADYWPMDCETLDTTDCEEPDTIDYEEYMEFMFDQLYNHKKEKQDAANKILAEATIAAFKTTPQHDLTIDFSNGAVLEVFALMNIKDGNDCECNIINICDEEFDNEQTLLV